MKPEHWYVTATFRDGNGIRVATAFLAIDLFTLPLFVASHHDHAWTSTSRYEAMSLRNKMSVDRTTYYDPISGKTFYLNWDITLR